MVGANIGNLSKNIMDTLRNANRLMGGTPGRRRQMAEEKRDEQSVQKPIDNSHSHSKQESQNGAMGSFAAFGGGTGSQNPNTNLAEIGRNAFNGIGLKRKNMNNNFTNPDSQTVASGMFQGQELENQMAQRRSTPTPVPGGRPDQDISPLMQSNYPHSSKDPVAKDHMNVYNSSTNDGEKNFLVTHSEKHGSEHINDGGVSKETKEEHDSLVGVYNKRNNLKEYKLKKN